MNCFRKSYRSCFAVFLVLAFLFTNSGYTSVYSNSATQEVSKGMTIDRIHPLHVDLLNVTEQLKNADLEKKKDALLKLLKEYAPENKQQTKKKLDQISIETADLKNLYADIYQKTEKTIKELQMQDIRSDRGEYFLINTPLKKVDRNGAEISGGNNDKYLDKIKEYSKLLETINDELNDFGEKIKGLIDKTGNNDFKKEEYKLQEEEYPFCTITLTSINEFSQNIEAFFEVYYNSYLEYNNLTFPYYKNSFCSLYTKEGIYKRNNIQIQCAAVTKEPKNSTKDRDKAAEYVENIEALRKALFLNSEILDKSPQCPGGGIFPRENIRISLAEEDYNKAITGVNFYEISKDGKSGTKNIIKNYKIDTNKARFGKGYIILDRTAILADYPYGTRPVKVRVEVVFSAKDTKVMETVFVPAYDEGHQIMGEDMMYLNSIRAQKFLHPLQIDDFKGISSTEDSLYYPEPGGYLLELDEEGSVKCAACIDSIDNDGNLNISYIKGFECGNEKPDEKKAVVSPKGIFGFGKYKLKEEKIQFNRYTLMPLADINLEFVKNMKSLLSDDGKKSNDAEDTDVIENILSGLNINNRKYMLPKTSIENKSADLNKFEGLSLYYRAFRNVFENYETYMKEKSIEEHDINKESLKYILLNIYDSQNLLSDQPETDYGANIEALKKTKIGSKIAFDFDLDKAQNDDKMVRALASACFPNEVKKLKLMQGSGSVDEKDWRLPLSGNIICLDIPNEIIFDEPSKTDRYLLWDMDKEKKNAVYIESKVEEGKTWHYILSSKENTEKLKGLVEDFILTKESGIICGYKISDKLFWQLLSKNMMTQISASWYDKVALSPLNELGYLCYRQFPYYYYSNTSTKGEVFVDPLWKEENIVDLYLAKSITIPVNTNVKESFEKVKTLLSNSKSDMGYSPRFIDKDPDKGLDNHAFGIATNMNWYYLGKDNKDEKLDKGKSFFWNSIYFENEKWKVLKNNLYKNGFVSGAFHGVNSDSSIEPNHIEVGCLEAPTQIKYLQSGTVISNVDVNEYKIRIDKPSLIKIDLYDWEGDYDLFLYQETKNGDVRVACSTCGIPDADGNSKNPEEVNRKKNESILKYIKKEKAGTYVLRVLGYSKKLCHDKYIIDVDISESDNPPGIIDKWTQEPFSGIFAIGDAYTDKYEIDDYYKKICDPIIKDKDGNGKKYSFDRYAIDAQNRWLWPLPSTNANAKNWPAYMYSGARHNGIDFAEGNDTGRLVRAVEDGTTKFSKVYRNGNFQYSVTIEHDNSNIKTEYTHLIQNSIMVKNEQKVKKGDIIGLLGDTGNSSASHLHFGIWMGGLNVDPLNRNIFDPKYDASYDLSPGTTAGDLISLIDQMKDYEGDPQDFIIQSKPDKKDEENYKKKYDAVMRTRQEIRRRQEEYKGYFGSQKLPNLPEYYEPVFNPNSENPVPAVQVNISKEGVKLDLKDSYSGKYAVSAFLIASGRGKDGKEQPIGTYHWHYIADIMSFRQKNTGNAFEIDWPKGENLERLRMDGDKNNVDYYLKVEVENIELGTSYFYVEKEKIEGKEYKVEKPVNKYIFNQE